MGACCEHLRYVERLSIDEGRQTGRRSRALTPSRGHLRSPQDHQSRR
jgi:hypothetical protein